MILTKSREMQVLLSALRIKPDEYEILENSINLKINQQQLMYAIVGSDAEVQNIFGYTNEWKELIKYQP